VGVMAGRRALLGLGRYPTCLGGGSGMRVGLKRCGLSRHDNDAEELRELYGELILSLKELIY
jgi:hypothetical protein